MAVKIPIVTVFDSKGIKQAQYQLRQVSGNINNLKRNFAVAGAAIVGSLALIGKGLQDAAESQKVFAQTEAVLKSTGQTANGTAKELQAFASSLQAATGFSDEAILSGQNLILTFKNIQNQAGAGNDIFDQTTQAVLDFARATGTDISSASMKFGRALNDPIKGMTALTRVGITFTDSQKEQIKTLVQSGDLLTAQKLILGELEKKFGGSAAAYASTFSGQLDILNNSLNDMSEEIGFAVMPAVTGLVSDLRELIPVIGPQIKAAIEAVDWKGLVTTLVNLVKWFTENAKAIGIVVGAMFALNTIYNAGRVAVGLYNAAAVIFNATMGATATATGVATGALKLFRIALATTGIGALLLVLGYLIERLINYTDETKSAYKVTGSWGGAIEQSGKQAEWAASRYGVAAAAARDFKNAVSGKPAASNAGGVMDAYGYNLKVGQPVQAPKAPEIDWDKLFGDMTGGAGAGATKKKSPLADLLKKLKEDGKKLKLEAKLIGFGISDGLAKQLSSNLPVKKIEAILKKIVDTGGKYAKKLQKLWNATAAGIAEVQGSVTDTTAQDAVKENSKTLVEAIKSLTDLFKAPKPELGVFQQQVVDAFDGIFEAIRTRWTNKRKQTQFLGVATFVKQQLEAIAKQRDEIAAKIERSKSFMASVVDSIISPMDITKLGRSAAQIMSNLRQTIEQTLNFRKQIQSLSDLGLGKNAIQQIIQAGAVEGGATAQALLAGGPEAINQINALYSELEATAGTFAETAGQVVYGAGVDISNGLIEGLLAQDAALRQAATTLGTSFSNYFKRALGISLRPETMDVAAVGTTRAGTVINLTVTAPFSSRPQDFGRLIVQAISDFERQSGPVFARA